MEMALPGRWGLGVSGQCVVTVFTLPLHKELQEKGSPRSAGVEGQAKLIGPASERSVGCTIARCATSPQSRPYDSAREGVTLYGFRLDSRPASFAGEIVFGEWTVLGLKLAGGTLLRLVLS